jgi:hypothetical protein
MIINYSSTSIKAVNTRSFAYHNSVVGVVGVVGVMGVVGVVGVGVWACGGVGFEHSKVCTLCDFGHLQFFKLADFV